MASENSDYSPDKAFRPRRAPGRERFDRATVHAILDDGYVAHAGFQGAQGPEIIPVFYVREGERVLIHLSAKAGLSIALKRGEAVTLAVTHLDGLILARSAFHHSMNYRSVIIHGAAVELTGEEKADALDLMVERVEEVRQGPPRQCAGDEGNRRLRRSAGAGGGQAAQRRPEGRPGGYGASRLGGYDPA